MTWKSYAAASGAGLLATYLFSSPATVPNRPAPAPAAAPGVATIPADIAEQAARLTARTTPRADYQEPERNPFRYGTTPAAARSVARPVDTPPPAAPASEAPQAEPQPPPFKLSGIAVHVVNGVRERRALLLTPTGLLSAQEGDMVGAFRLTHIEEEAVQLEGPDGTTLRFPLRP